MTHSCVETGLRPVWAEQGPAITQLIPASTEFLRLNA